MRKNDNQFVNLFYATSVKAAHKMLVKLPPVVNFISFFLEHFLYEKCVRKMLMKLTPEIQNRVKTQILHWPLSLSQ